MIVVATLCLLVLVLALIPCLYRVVVGPHPLDRLLAFDLTGVLLSAALAVFAIVQDSWVYLEISIGLAVLAFVSTLAIARYIERRRIA